MFLHKTPTVIRWLYPQLKWTVPTDEKIIHLTFDDGPIPGITDFILDSLWEHQANATFFCVGDNLQKHPQIAKRAINEGHLLANHTYNHLNGWDTNTCEYLQNIEKCTEQLLQLGQKKKLLRPPYGKIRREQISRLKMEYDIIMWDVLSGDYSRKIDPQSCLQNSIKATRPGSIVLFHDNIKAEKNLKYTLPRYLQHFKRAGYQFKTL
ncbi:Polysaccharide deacetylase [Fulvivirga imtechensis AK7]|uniref:Polysaccharide deacetylase n=1 Tax=Fulvivirga imtechensis AK7 TaxID=1237149 RepID=L8JPZ7_9BACT|nr:polysaccharide deacetylase family protein [Fulvivirga imtechensis]ELR69579.1 Polysaccharide deacetylase [Fulvivirga imtechensis AK7]